MLSQKPAAPASLSRDDDLSALDVAARCSMSEQAHLPAFVVGPADATPTRRAVRRAVRHSKPISTRVVDSPVTPPRKKLSVRPSSGVVFTFGAAQSAIASDTVTPAPGIPLAQIQPEQHDLAVSVAHLAERLLKSGDDLATKRSTVAALARLVHTSASSNGFSPVSMLRTVGAVLHETGALAPLLECLGSPKGNMCVRFSNARALGLMCARAH